MEIAAPTRSATAQPQAHPPVSHLGAVALAIAGFTFWVLCDSAVKIAGRSHLPPYEISAFLGIFMALSMALYAVCRGTVRTLRPLRPAGMLGRSALDAVNNLFVVVALRHLSLTLFYILVFTSPMVVTVLGRLFLHERLQWRKATAILTGFLGVLVAVHPSHAGRPSSSHWIGLLACAVCVACFSISLVWSRTMSQDERPETMVFFSGAVTALAGLVCMSVHAAAVPPRLLGTLVLTGVLCALGNICVFTALKYAPAATVSHYHYTQLLSGAVVAWLLFHEKPTPSILGGAVLIVASGLYIAWAASRFDAAPLAASHSLPDRVT